MGGFCRAPVEPPGRRIPRAAQTGFCVCNLLADKGEFLQKIAKAFDKCSISSILGLLADMVKTYVAGVEVIRKILSNISRGGGDEEAEGI